MKLKYYLRGLGIGIIVTTIILMVSFSGRKEEMSDEETARMRRMAGMIHRERTRHQVVRMTHSRHQREVRFRRRNCLRRHRITQTLIPTMLRRQEAMRVQHSRIRITMRLATMELCRLPI